MKKNHAVQKAENQKIQAAIKVLKTEKTNLHQHLLDLKRRVAELEQCIGDEQWKELNETQWMKLQFLAHAIAAERELNSTNAKDLEVTDQYEDYKVKMDGLSNNAVLSPSMR